MLFNSPLYAVFLFAVWIVFWSLRTRRRARSLILVAASYGFYFYGTWDAAREEPVPLPPLGWALLCLSVLFVGSTVDFFVGLALGRAKARFWRNALLGVSIAYYVGVLSVFKYWNFAADSIASVFVALGVRVPVAHLRLVLPFGISFFTIETVSYTVDVWRGHLQPSRRYLDYLLFVSFFPHLVAGPIVRPRPMLAQFAMTPRADAAMQTRGLWRIACGLSKKIVVGDYLAQAIVDRVFSAPERFTALEVLLAAYGYAMQIYADFSGYTDVAIGSAALFGYELPENFDAPYASSNLQEFWRRWHISLSSWLRDYVYKPLGGSRQGAWRLYRNLAITMLLGGLWHGAAWTFVVWGALHGAALALTRMWQRAREAARRKAGMAFDTAAPATGIRRWVFTAACFQFVCFAWVFFRAPTLAHAQLALNQLARGAWTLEHVSARVAIVIGAAMLLHLLPRRWDVGLREAFVRTPALVQGVVLAAVALGLRAAAGARPEPFVYGQF
jgi:D-alanyl-lipoteichoic acid acyltransferase DltB (MBOAT superfamily)